MKIEVSTGEIFDKLSILEIKKAKVKDINKLVNINTELLLLSKCFNSILLTLNKDKLIQLYESLKKVNESLWEIEDAIRIKEKNNEFDEDFIELTKSVYITNDNRSDIKYEINKISKSEIIEEKNYVDYL